MHRVLLVDDEIYVRKGLLSLIDWEGCGFEVENEADNGEYALDLIEQTRPDLVITDIRMPVLDGLELVRKARERNATCPEFIIISGYDDFKYAQQAVRYGVYDFILKPIDEHSFENALKKLCDKLRQDQLLRNERKKRTLDHSVASLIAGEATEAEVVYLANQLDVRPSDEFVYLFVELNDILPWRIDHEPPSSEFVQATIRRAVSAIAGMEKAPHLLEHHNRIGFLMSLNDLRENCPQRVEQFAEKLQRTLADQLQEKVYVYAGQTVKSLAKLGESYRTAKEALLYKFIDEHAQTLIYERLHQFTLNYIDLDSAHYSQMATHIEENDAIAIEHSIAQIFSEFRKHRYAPEAVKLVIHRCISSIVKIIKDMGIDEHELDTLEQVMGWQDLNVSPGELKRIFTGFTLESAQLLAERRKQNMKGDIQKIKHYIEQHYRENLSLKNIAGKFFMNSVYLGQLFKKAYGIYFKDFLLQVRVNEAKKLLRQTDLRIYEVAEQVGFSNAEYFVTQFEKIEQRTPTEYRNMLLKSK